MFYFLQLKHYHFLPPGILHPITAIYELRYGENEVGQSEIRRSLHSRLGLPLDRPLLRIASALTFGTKANNIIRNGYPYLKNVHTQIPISGVSEGIVSLVDGSYEYYHYLLDGIDDNALIPIFVTPHFDPPTINLEYNWPLLTDIHSELLLSELDE
ncbi:hypothetical protein IEQ34_003260 [Dendrobium chrysotoxum]|uniref:UFSP2 second domain-containing protein n=1 Tax=Dendrobium chrysotoxum TaxID=161865 RepID=A0AAV7HK51_DENCH|nr:hypothetical protein IEQ34_003260 [Dendrobium chrysotoxum]